MIYAVRHRTTFEYETRVSFARCVLRLTPASTAEQTVLQTALAITPEPTASTRRTGPFGEEVQTIVVETPHRELIIDSRSRVDVHAAPVPISPSPAWETVRTAAFEDLALGPEGPAAYLYPTPRTPITGVITEYARTSFAAGRPVLEAGAELMARMRADFVYDGDATDVRTPVGVAFEARRGVCQDFAHIMLCGLRGLGLPAAYVSGYLRTRPPPGRPRLEGADATHAWVRLWCGPERGWVGLDPTNALLVEDDHVVLAVGRDYADVAPIDGIILAPGEQELEVEVDVVPEGAAALG